MAITKLSNSGIKTQTNLKYDSMLAGNAAYIPTAYQSIATITVTSSSAGEILFSGIPATYKHLVVRGVLRTDNASTNDSFNLIYNNNFSGYSNTFLTAYATNTQTSTSTTSLSTFEIARIAGASAGSNYFAPILIDILDYTNTSAYKSMRAYTGLSNNGSASRIYIYGGSWENTSAITSLKFTPVNGSGFVQNSTIALYGLKG